ncbi:MAG TPA: asparagine synthase (glutamine-hydrolyzing) [Burkholderiales bacterium]
MGAIAGWVAGRSAPDEAALLPALEALAHRGASGEGLFAYRTDNGHRVALGQPWFDEAAGIAVALDGALANRAELKNQLVKRGYAFAGENPAETLARAYEHWDKDVVHQLRGAFAFALWDARKERLMLARDRLGEKPLYVCEQGAFFFGSEIKALLRMPGVRAEADPTALRDYLAYRYVPGSRTLVRGVRKIAPGSYALWQFGRSREVRYWVLPDQRPLSAKPSADPVNEFTEKLEEAVKLQLPAGVLLSGGFDSAALVALGSRHARLKTYSAAFADDAASELERAAQVAKHFGTEHHEIVLAPRDVVARLPQVVAHRDGPVSRPADVALHFLACEATRSSPALITGEGSDEILGGYRRHVAERYDWIFRSMPTLLFLAQPLVRGRPQWQAAFASLRTPDWPRRYVRWTGAVDLDERDRLFPGKNELPSFEADAKASRLRRALYYDQVSMTTMAASLDARAPFLDHRLVEFVSTLPDDLRVRGLSTKWILRQAARPLLPKLKPRKGGFAIPAGAWLRGDLRDYVLEHLRGQGSLTRAYYEPRVLDRVLDEHLAGKRNNETVLWTLLNLEIWHRTFLRG